MNIATTSAPAADRVDQAAPPTRRVIDAPTRVFHWLFALCFVGAYLTADGERWRLLHVVLGYTLAGLLAFRVLYGLLGPRQARLSTLWNKLGNAPFWLRSIKAAWFERPVDGRPKAVNWRQGQNLAMAAAVVTMLLLVLPLTFSGYAVFHEWGGDWLVELLEEVHEAVGELFLWVVLLHLGLILLMSLLRRKNQALPMLTGRVEGAGPDLARRNHRWLALLLLVGVLSYWSWEWTQAPAPASGAAVVEEQSDRD